MLCNELTSHAYSQITFRIVTTNEEEARKYMILMRRWVEEGKLLNALSDQDLPFDSVSYTRKP
jgi:hypothetical protein